MRPWLLRWLFGLNVAFCKDCGCLVYAAVHRPGSCGGHLYSYLKALDSDIDGLEKRVGPIGGIAKGSVWPPTQGGSA